jgi:hypothetical protein
MRKVIVVLIFCIIVVLSCLKDETKSNDVQINFTYQIYLDNSNRIVKFFKTFENGSIIEKHLYTYDSIAVKQEVYDSYNVLLAKFVYFLNDKGYADSSVDTIYLDNALKTYNKKYTYESDFLVRINIIEKEFENTILKDTIAYSMRNYVENENIVKSVKTVDTTCTIHYTYNSKATSVDVINWTNTILGKANKNLVQSITYFPDCPCSSTSKPATSVFDYALDASNRIITSVETFIPCSTNQNYKEVTTITYKYTPI